MKISASFRTSKVIVPAITIFLPLVLPALRAGEAEAKRSYLEGWYLETAERQPAKAVEAYRRAVEAGGSDRHSAMALLRIGICLRSLGKEKDAREALEQLVEKYPGEADLVTRARRYLEGRTDRAVAALPVRDPRLEVLSLLEDMIASEEKASATTVPRGIPTRREDAARFLGILRLASPEYVRDVVLAKDPRFGLRGRSALGAFRYDRESLPDADPHHLLTFSGIPELRGALYLYIGLKEDRSIVPRLREQLGSADPDLRAQASEVLGDLGVKGAASRILELFQAEEDPGRATRLARSLGRLRHTAAVEALAARATSGALSLEAAAETLSRIGTREAVDRLRPFLLSDSLETLRDVWLLLDPPRDGPAAAQLISIGRESRNPVQLYYALTRTPLWRSYPSVQESILPSLGAVLLGQLERASREEIPLELQKVDETAYRQLTSPYRSAMTSGSTQECPAWIGTLADSLRSKARRSTELGLHGLLEARLQDSLARFYRSLLATPLEGHALYFFLDHWEDRPDFLELLRAQDPELRAAAVKVAYGGAPTELWARIGTDPGAAVEAKIAVLRKYRYDRRERRKLEPAFRALIADPDPDVVLAALDALGAARLIRTPRSGRSRGAPEPQPVSLSPFGDAVRRLLESNGDNTRRPPSVRRAALDLLARAGDHEGCLLALRDPLPRLRLRAARAASDTDKAYTEAVLLEDVLLERYLVEHLAKTEWPASQLEEDRRVRAAWVRRLGSLCGSRSGEIRRKAFDLLSKRSTRIPADMGLPLALRALEDETPAVRRIAFELLRHYEEWEPLLGAWDELLQLEPGPDIALEAAVALDRIDLLRALREHSSPEIRFGAARAIFERAGAGEIASFLSDPEARVRLAAVEKLAQAHDLEALAPALADPEPSVAKRTHEALSGFSEEVQAALDSTGAREEAFEGLPVDRRKEIAAAVGRWLEEKGKTVWIGRGKDFLERARQLRESDFYRNYRGSPQEQRKRVELDGQYRKLCHQGTEILTAALPDAAALEILLTNPHARREAAATAFVREGLKDALRRLFEKQKEEQEVDGVVLEGLAKLKLHEELRTYAEETRDIRTFPLLANLGGGKLALRLLKESLRSAHRPDHGLDDELIKVSAELGPQGPLVLLDLLAKEPFHEKEKKLLIDALKRCRSSEGLQRALLELPEPPAREIFDALLEIGAPGVVLDEAREGEFWYEAASALRAATGKWFGYFTAAWTEAEPPPKAGLLRVTIPEETRDGRGRRLAEVEFLVDPDTRRAAVEAWRRALKHRGR